LKDYFANILIFLGLIFLFIGLFFKIFPFFGKLPGDISIKGKNYAIYIPLASSILLSIFLTLILNLIFYFFKKINMKRI